VENLGIGSGGRLPSSSSFFLFANY
jgi:hypothetical protein